MKTMKTWYRNACKVREELNNGEWAVCPYPTINKAYELVKKDEIPDVVENYDKIYFMWVANGVWFLRLETSNFSKNGSIRFGFFKFWVWYCSPIRKILKEFKLKQQLKIKTIY